MHRSIVNFKSMLWQSPIVNISNPRIVRGPNEGHRIRENSLSSIQATSYHENALWDRVQE